MRNYRKPPRNEAELEKRVRDWCKDNAWKRKKMSSPGSRGTLDDYFVKNGRHVWIEMKHGSNTPSGLQWKEIKDLRLFGAEAYWCNTLDQVVSVLNNDADFLDALPPQEEYLL